VPLGDDNIVLRITADRAINAVAAVVDPNDIVAVTFGKIDRGVVTRYFDVIVTGAAGSHFDDVGYFPRADVVTLLS
jgi:hypothetical protein